MIDGVTFLGTADGVQDPRRGHAALLFELAGKRVLVDCGEPCADALARHDVAVNSLDGVIITHTHSDHVGGLPMLMQSCWLEGRSRELPVWLPAHAIEPLRAWLNACYLFPETLPFRVRWHPLRALRIGAVRVRPVRSSHLDRTRLQFAARHPEVGFDAFSLLIETPKRRLVYSADLGSADDLRPLIAKPVDLLITELAHFHPQQLVKVLGPGTVRHLAITHIARSVRARLPAVKRLLARAVVGRLSYARDGQRVML